MTGPEGVPGPWAAVGPVQFVDRRSRLTRRDGLVRQNVRAFRGTVVRKGANGKPEYDHCPHAHQKAAVARKCAERAAAAQNRLDARRGA